MGKPRRDTHLMARWSKGQGDLLYYHPDRRVDARLLDNVFARPHPRFDGSMGKTFLEELEARGYDLTTLRFSVALKPAAVPPPGDQAGDKEKTTP